MGLFNIFKKKSKENLPENSVQKNASEIHSYYNEAGIKISSPEKYTALTQQEGGALINSLLNADEIYCPYSRHTGEPYVFQTIKVNDNTFAAHPSKIKAWDSSNMQDGYDEEIFEIRKIERGENGNGIMSFLMDTFYLNGVAEIEFNGINRPIPAGMLTKKPDFSNLPEVQQPIMNPEIMLYLLTTAQIGSAKTEGEQIVTNIYMQLFAENLRNAKFLVPMKNNAPIPNPDENGKVVLEKNTSFILGIRKNEHGRDIMDLFTDNKQLHNLLDDEWGGLIQPFTECIKNYDCCINFSQQYPMLPFYIDMKRFQQLMAMVK